MTRHQLYYQKNREKEIARARANTKKKSEKRRMEKKSRAEYYRKYNALNRDKKREQDRKSKDRKALAKGTKPTPRRYATREVDLSQMRHVQVNAKTWVLAPKDADPETVKQQFLKIKAA